MSDKKDFDAYSNYDDRPKVEKTKVKTIDYSIQNTREEFAEEHHPAPQKNAHSKNASRQEPFGNLVDGE